MQHDVQEFSRILQDKLEIKMKVGPRARAIADRRARQRKEPFLDCSREA
jgi:hypothetical protein